jgi:hypothetical protein
VGVLALLGALSVSACAGSGASQRDEPLLDPDDPAVSGSRGRSRPVAAEAAPEQAPAAGEDSAGTVPRASVLAVLDAGPGVFLAGLDLEPVFRERSFAGWQIARFSPRDERVGRAPIRDGDIIFTVNARSLERPEDLHRVWDDLRVAREIVVVGERGGAPLHLRYHIQDGGEVKTDLAEAAASRSDAGGGKTTRGAVADKAAAKKKTAGKDAAGSSRKKK